MMNIPQAHVVDGYKLGHIDQYINKTEYVGSNMTPRSDKLARVIREHFDGKLLYMGLQMAMKNMVDSWESTFFSVDEDQVIKAYSRRIKNYLGTDHGNSQIKAMRELHKLGYLPIQIKSLPEGSKVNMGIPVFTVKNTDKRFYWLTNYLETYLSCMVWPVVNAASLSEQYMKTSIKWGEVTGADPFWVNIANHCFAGRGHRGEQDAMISGMGHLACSKGTDTLWAIDGVEYYYNADSDKEFVACSVNAFEHATATQRIAYYRKKLNYTEFPLQAEVESLRSIVRDLYPTGIISYVADSEDYFGLLETGLPLIKDEILARKEDSSGLCKTVFRPDSSPKTPFEIIMGDEDAVEGSAEYKGSLQLLWDVFGGSINEKGYRVLNPKVGIIYGEAIDMNLQNKIYKAMECAGWCVSNILFGVGSWGFLDRSSRDSFSFAIKGTNSVVDGEEISMQKNPKTAQGSKKSAKGLLRVEFENDKYVLYDQQTPEQELQGELKTVFLDGVLTDETTLEDIRSRVLSNIK